MRGTIRSIFASLTVACWLAGPSMAATVDIEAFKDNSVFRDSQSQVGDFSNQNGGTDLTVRSLDCGSYLLTLAAFDLSALPAGAQITSAQISVYDQRTNNSYTAYVSLADVDDTWDESTLTWTTAAANMHVVVGTEQTGGTLITNGSMVDFAYIDWQGTLIMNANPGRVYSSSRGVGNLYSGTDTYHDGVAWTDADLVGALNGVLAGDKVAVFTVSSVYGKNQFFSERNSSDADGPLLHLEYEIVPEPASVGLMALGAAMVFACKRD